jgi:hypothetical protein
VGVSAAHTGADRRVLEFMGITWEGVAERDGPSRMAWGVRRGMCRAAGDFDEAAGQRCRPVRGRARLLRLRPMS